MARNLLRTGKRARPKTAVKGKRYRCARCHKRSPKPVKTPAPWYCPKCLEEKDDFPPQPKNEINGR
jgi:ribosomal protein L37AE/L43A